MARSERIKRRHRTAPPAMTALSYPDPPLADDAVCLRPWCDADVDPAHAATQDPLIPRYTRAPRGQTREGLRAFIADRELQRRAGEVLSFVIAEAGTDPVLATLALLPFFWEGQRAAGG